MTHTFLGTTINFNVFYKKRKTIGICIDFYGNVEVTVPKDLDVERIVPFLEEKWDWIQQNSKEVKDRLSGNMDKVYEHGEIFLYLGNSYPILISVNMEIDQDHVIFKENKLNIYIKLDNEESIKKALKRFYYQQCKALVEGRIRIYQSDFKTKPRSIRIADDNSNWGTCNSKFELTFNWKLAMASIEVIDYVVVHEMCHMIHLNHERSFWRLVGKILPDYEQRKDWLTLSNWKMVV